MVMLRTSEVEHERLVQFALERGLDKPPRRPDPRECCDKNCGLCIWDYYNIRRKRWRAIHNVPDPADESDLA